MTLMPLAEPYDVYFRHLFEPSVLNGFLDWAFSFVEESQWLIIPFEPF